MDLLHSVKETTTRNGIRPAVTNTEDGSRAL